MSSIREKIADVLAAHPLIVGEDYYAGQIICDGCHLCLGSPANHLTEMLARALDPEYSPAGAAQAVKPGKLDPRESQISWESS